MCCIIICVYLIVCGHVDTYVYMCICAMVRVLMYVICVCACMCDTCVRQKWVNTTFEISIFAFYAES